jgi:hypothetical protein
MLDPTIIIATTPDPPPDPAIIVTPLVPGGGF